MNSRPLLHARTILVLEDDVVALDTMRKRLEAHGAQVMTATNGVDGFTELARRRPDAILCDLTMPVMDGLEFGRRLRSQPRYQQVLLIAVTGRDRLADLTDTWLTGFDGHLAKPVTPAALSALVARIAEHTRHLDPPPIGVPSPAQRNQEARPPRVLGDLLYADPPTPLVLEADWAELIRSIAARDPRALQTLFQRAHRLVFSLAVRITHHGKHAEDATLAVFDDVWRRAATYDAASESVVGWIMKQARVRGIEHRRFAPLDAHGRRYTEAPAAAGATDLFHPSPSLWERLAQRLRGKTRGSWRVSTAPQWVEPEWRAVAPGIACQLLATDSDRHRVSTLVRLAPRTDYPPHRHDAIEELYMLHGVLMVDEDTFYPGDYRRAPAGAVDRRVWSETGCTGVLLTSLGDVFLD